MKASKACSLTKRTGRILKLYTLLALCLTVGMTVWHLSTLLTEYDWETGFYSLGSTAETVTGWALFVATLLLFSCVFLVKKNESRAIRAIAPGRTLSSLLFSLAGGAFVVYSVWLALHLPPQYTLSSGVVYVVLFLAIPCCAYFLFSAVSQSRKNPLLTILGFAPVLWFCFVVIHLYFDRTTAINNPVKTLVQLSLIVIMLFFLFELKCRVGKNGESLWFAFGLLSVLYGLSTSLSLLIAEGSKGILAGSDAVLLGGLLLLSVAVAVRLFTCAFGITKGASFAGCSHERDDESEEATAEEAVFEGEGEALSSSEDLDD